MDMNRYIMIILGLILLVVSGWMLFYQEPVFDEEKIESEEVVVLADQYNCQGNVNLFTRFINEDDAVELTLPNNRKVILQSLQIDSGARYESLDGLLVFLIDGEEAYVEREGETVYTGCKAVTKEMKEVPAYEEEDIKETLLVDYSWQWRETVYFDTEDVRPNRPEEFVVTFDDSGNVTALTDCNSMMGGYEVSDGGAIKFSEMASTLMYCEGSQEIEFGEMLSKVERYDFDEGDLVLFLSDDEGLFIFDPVKRIER